MGPRSGRRGESRKSDCSGTNKPVSSEALHKTTLARATLTMIEACLAVSTRGYGRFQRQDVTKVAFLVIGLDIEGTCVRPSERARPERHAA